MYSMQINWQIILLICIVLFTFKIMRHKMESFVPYNSFEAPTTRSEDVNMLNIAQQKYGTLVQNVNSTNFALSYELNSLINTLQAALDATAFKRYKIVSIGQTLPFSFIDVTITDNILNEIYNFKRIDFIVSSLNPFVIEKIIITPTYEKPTGLDELGETSSTLFRIKNKLGLFYPYPTSYNDSLLSSIT